ncbi:head-tail joining protein [Sneathiella sp.]|uniref:head-tail joining protein n=1 Tax=Sneathiella sp. TaxID=1964365 RepID=UPI002FDF34CD
MSFSRLADDLAAACQETFGEGALYTPLNHSPVPLNVIFDLDHVVIEGDGEVGVETVKPAVTVRVSDTVAAGFTPRHGDTVTVRDIAYVVVAVEPDGEAQTTLIMRRAGNA